LKTGMAMPDATVKTATTAPNGDIEPMNMLHKIFNGWP